MTALLDAAVTALQGVQGGLPVGTPLVAGTATFQAVQTATAAAAGTIGGNLSSADAAMGALVKAAGSNVIAGTDGASGVASLLAFGSATQDLAGLAVMNGYVERMAANLKNASD